MSTSHPRPRSTMLRAAAGSAAAATLVLATGCNGIGGSDDLTEIEIALPTGVTSMANSDIAVADELGYFEEAGLEVEVTNLRSGSSVTNGVVGGDFQVGGASIEPVINAFAGGAYIRVIGGYTDRLEVDVVVPENVQSVADLQGRDLGIQEIGAFREVMTRMMLEDAQMTPDDVEYVSVSADAYVSALIQGQIASAVLHPEQAIQATEQRSEEHTSELQSRGHLVCRLLLEKKKQQEVKYTKARISSNASELIRESDKETENVITDFNETRSETIKLQTK